MLVRQSFRHDNRSGSVIRQLENRTVVKSDRYAEPCSRFGGFGGKKILFWSVADRRVAALYKAIEHERELFWKV